LPLYWKRIRIRDAALAVAVVAVLYVPFLNRGRIPIGSLGTYVQNFRFNGPVFGVLDRVAPPQLLVGLALLAGLATATWFRRKGLRDERTLNTGDTELLGGNAASSPLCSSVPSVVQGFEFAWPMAASLFCAPAVFPWYLLWLLPFLTSASTVLIIIWTVSIIPVYIQWHLRALGHPWGALPGWIMLVEYGCLGVAAAIIALRRIDRPTSARRSTG
jgi:alpha-1,6-mannosyltransferase